MSVYEKNIFTMTPEQRAERLRLAKIAIENARQVLKRGDRIPDTRIPAKIRRMSKRRQKIALRRVMHADLQRIIGKSNPVATKAEVTKVFIDKNGYITSHIDVMITPPMPVQFIQINLDLNRAKPS